MTPERRAMSWMIALVALWGMVEVLAGVLHRPYSAYQVVWTRYGVHLLFMLALWGWREPSRLWRTSRPGLQWARSMLMLVMPAAVITAIGRGVDLLTIWTVFWVAPLLLLAFAAICLGEWAPPAVWIASAVAIAGTTLLIGPGVPRSFWSLALPLVSAASFSLYVVMTRMLRHESIRANLFYTALGVFVALTPIVPKVWMTPSPRDFVVLCAIGILGFCVLYALDRMASSAALPASSPMTSLQVAFAIGADSILLHRVPGARAWVGACLVGGAAVWMWMSRTPTTVASNT
jgi:drug/metabolite transporter (DMT)-like permease